MKTLVKCVLQVLCVFVGLAICSEVDGPIGQAGSSWPATGYGVLTLCLMVLMMAVIHWPRAAWWWLVAVCRLPVVMAMALFICFWWGLDKIDQLLIRAGALGKGAQ